MTASAARRLPLLLLLLTLTSLSAASAAAAEDPEIGVCRKKCLSQQHLNTAEQNVCLHLCEDYAEAKSKKESEPGSPHEREEPDGEIQHCEHECRSARKIDGRRKKLCELECAGRKQEKQSEEDQRASGVGGWRKGKRIEEICKQWCWDLPAGGVGEIECLKDCFKVYGVRGIPAEIITED